MQVSTIMTDLIEFKDEIFKKVRLLESRLTTEVNTKYSEMNNNFEKLDNRINFISENNDSLLEIVTSQKMNLDKVTELESFKNKIEQNMIMHDIKLKSLSADIDKIKSKYDKAIYENLQVPGYVGPGCQFKTISEYITNNIFEFSKLKNDRDQIKIENVEVKNRLDNILKSTLNLIDTSILRCQKYSDTKHQDMQNILNNKLIEFSEKNMDLRTQITKTEMQNEQQIQNLKMDVEKLLLMKNELITLTDQKIEEINQKIELMTQEINTIKLKKKEKLKEKEFINEKTNSSGNYKNKSNKNIYNEDEEVNNQANISINDIIKKNQNKLQNKNTNLMINSNSNIYNTINPTNNLNNNVIENPINSKVLEVPKITKISNYFNDTRKRNQNKEEKLSNLSEDEHSSQNFDKIIPMKFKNINEHFSLNEKVNEINENNKVEENNVINNIQKYYKHLNNNHKIMEEKKAKDFSAPDIKQLNKVDDSNNINNSNLRNLDIKDSSYFYKNKNKSNTKKIKIHSLEKNKITPTNSSLNISEFRNKKEESEKEYIENQDYNIKSNNNQNIIKNVKSKTLNLTKKKFSKINNNAIKINNKEDNNFFSAPKEFHSIEKSEKMPLLIYNNEEQNQIMNQIKTFYNIKKEKYIQKSQENVVDCNIINLNLEKPKKISGSANNNYLTKDTKLRNNLSEIGMKISPVFGRTTYSFYNRKDINSINNVFQNNKKINSLKDRLNLAFVSSIKQRIKLKDKAINVQ